MKRDDIRLRLIDGTIHVIARDGLDKATTKSIGEETSINQVYIYRNFKDKEDMFAKTFESLDAELFNVAMQHLPIMYNREIDYEARCRMFFNAVWKFLLGNQDKCTAYIRYYYSPYFKQYSSESHCQRYEPVIEKFREAFREEAHVNMILEHILNVMLDFAIKVFNGTVPDDDDTEEHVFRLVYHSIKQYFR